MLGLHLLRSLSLAGIQIFSIEQARVVARNLNLNERYIPEVLHKLCRDGWVNRLKKGVYAVSPESGFANAPHEFMIASALVSPSVISHWTAMHFHQMTQQIPNTIFATTLAETSIPRTIDKSRYRFVQTKPEHFFGDQTVWIDEHQVKITNPERTLLDGLISPQYCGGFLEVFGAFQSYRDHLNIELIIEYAMRLDHATIKRLGWVLEKIGVSQLKLQKLLEVPIKGYRKLDASAPTAGTCNSKWMIRENIGEV